MKPEHRLKRGCGFLPSVVITGLLLYGGFWLSQSVEVNEAQPELGASFSNFAVN
jgi:hypothetical protein